MTTKTTERVNLAAALAAFQAELPTVGKDAKATIPPKDGKSGYSYKYAGLGTVSEAVLPLLGKHGLSFSSKPTIADGRFVLAYALRHSSGEEDSGEYPLPDPTKVSAQGIGSAITYARRYCLLAVTGVSPDEDDDGASAPNASRQQVDWHDPEPTWNPHEQKDLREQYELDLRKAKTQDELGQEAARIQAAFRTKKISPAVSDHLLQVWAECRAELDGGGTDAGDRVAETVST